MMNLDNSLLIRIYKINMKEINMKISKLLINSKTNILNSNQK